MFNLEKSEKIIILCLILALVVGLGVRWYGKTHLGVNIHVESFNNNVQNMDEAYLRERSKININEAGVEDLMALKGVGKVLAQRIVDYRSSKGRLYSIEELRSVKGIGAKLFDKIKDRVSIE